MKAKERKVIAAVLDSLDGAWDGSTMEYDIQGVNQAHRMVKQLFNGEEVMIPRAVNLKGGSDA